MSKKELNDFDYMKAASVVDYADIGWHMIPINYSKLPVLKSWQHECSIELDQLSEWFLPEGDDFTRRNVGIVTGAVSGVFCVDIDMKHGKDGIKSLWDWTDPENEGMGAFERFMDVYMGGDYPYQVTPTSGCHLFFKLSEGMEVRNGADILSGIDVRGTGGFVVAAPSTIYDDGEFLPYIWRNVDYVDVEGKPVDVDPEDIDTYKNARPVLTDLMDRIPEPPEWVLDLLKLQKEGSQTGKNGGGGSNGSFDLAGALRGLCEGSRDNELNKLCYMLMGKKIHYDMALNVVLYVANRCSPAFEESDAIDKLNRAYANAKEQKGSALQRRIAARKKEEVPV